MSDALPQQAVPVAGYQRAEGKADIVLRDADGRPKLGRAWHQGATKLRFPAAMPGTVEAMVLNTAGGLASGDRFHLSACAMGHTLMTSTQASERVYRAEGGPATVVQELSVRTGAALRHLPQPTIVFDRARLTRRTRIDVSPGGALTFCEGFVLGRAAMGETVETLALSDRTDVFVGGALAFVDATRIGSDALARRQRAAVLSGHRAFGIVIHCAADPAETRDGLERVRALLEPPSGASFLGGLVVARLLAPTHSALQDALARVTSALTGAPPPRAWQL